MVKNILAFHPIGETRVQADDVPLRNDPELLSLAKNLGTTPVKLLLQFHKQRGIIPIPKSAQKQHLTENFENIEPLSEEIMQKIKDMDKGKRFYHHKWIQKLSKFYPFSIPY